MGLPTARRAWINRSATDVYRYASDPARTRVGDTWVAQSPMGQITIEFTPANDLGVLDHVITMPSGEPVFNPLRVVPAGDDWSEVVFTLRRRGSTARVMEDALAQPHHGSGFGGSGHRRRSAGRSDPDSCRERNRRNHA